jgi:hypothetical protein
LLYNIYLQNANTTINAFTGIEFLVGGNGEAAISAIRSDDGAADIAFGTRYAGSRSQKMLLTASGNLGLGVTPTSGWTINAKVAQIGARMAVYNDGSNNALFSNNMYFDGSNNRYIATAASARYYLSTDGSHIWNQAASGTAGNVITFTQAMTLDASGNLLVGTTTPKAQITADFNGSSTNGIGINDTASANGTVFASFWESSTSIGTIQRVTTTNAVVYNTTSDYRLKTVTGSVTGQGERIDALKPIDYQWKEGNQQARGFLAHEFQTVYPNSVSGEKDAIDSDGKPVYQSMQASTSEVIADLVAEIQSLRQRITTLENK